MIGKAEQWPCCVLRPGDSELEDKSALWLCSVQQTSLDQINAVTILCGGPFPSG